MIFLCDLCLLSLWHNVGFEFEVSIRTLSHCAYCAILCHTLPYFALLCHTLPYFAILCHTLPYFAVLCYTLPCRPELNLCLRRKSHFQENGHHYFLRSISNLLNKINRFSTAGEVRGISMKIGIGEIYKNQLFYQL